MEKKKQLNFSAPLLSVRRYSSPRATTNGVNRKTIEKSPPGRQHSHPVKRSEWESEEVTKPAAVPFLWEKFPGRPKGECMTKSGEEPSVTPRLPPGRLYDASQKSGEVITPKLPSGKLTDVRHRSGEVSSPRLPPGRLTDTRHRSGEVSSPRFPPGRLTDVRHRSGEVSSPRFPPGRLTNIRYRSGELSTPKFPPGRLTDVRHRSSELPREQNINNSEAEALAVNDHASLLESLKESLYIEGESDKENGEDSFSDAFDTLSPTESLSLNCSISGLSGSYGWNCKPSGAFSIDPQTKDLMMSRFLPAAKAVVLEIPQYVPRKQNVSTEQPELVKKAILQEKKPLVKQPGSDVSSFYNQYTEDVESEDGEDDHDDPARIIGKSCGFFPRLCVKNSLSLLNPISATKLRTQASTPVVGVSATKLRTQPSTPAVGEVKRLTRNAYSGPLDKQIYDAIYKKRYHSGVLSQELHKVGNKLMNDPRRNSFSSESYKGEGLSPFRRPRSGGISPYRNERPPSPFREGARFLGLPKEVEIKANKISSFGKTDNKFQYISSQSSKKPGSESFGYAVEKTLYIDSVNVRVTPNMNVDFSKSERSLNSSSRKLKTMTTESRGVEEYLAAKSPGQDVQGHMVLEGGSNANSKSESLDTVVPSSTFTSDFTGSADKMENLNLNKILDHEKSCGFTDLQSDGNLEMKNEDNLKRDDQRESNTALMQSPLPPPLPKSPSESWLWRTLPSISLRNPFSHSNGSHLQSKKQSPKQSNTHTKWETMVKSSNIHYDHVRYSEELISHIPRQHSRK